MAKAALTFFLVLQSFVSITYAFDPVFTPIGAVAAALMIFGTYGGLHKPTIDYTNKVLHDMYDGQNDVVYKTDDGKELEICDIDTDLQFVIREGPNADSLDSVNFIGYAKKSESVAKIGSSVKTDPDTWQFHRFSNQEEEYGYMLQNINAANAREKSFLAAYERYKHYSFYHGHTFKAQLDDFGEIFVPYCRVDNMPGKYFRVFGTNAWLTGKKGKHHLKKSHTLQYVETESPKTAFTLIESTRSDALATLS